jgi:hypothetical protein
MGDGDRRKEAAVVSQRDASSDETSEVMTPKGRSTQRLTPELLETLTADVSTPTATESIPFETPPAAKTRRLAWQRVRVIRCEGFVSLVEWRLANGDFKRVVLPTERIVDGQALDSDLEIAELPRGWIEWERVLQSINITPTQISKALHKAGFFTSADVLFGFRRVKAVILELIAPLQEAILTQARKE